MKVQTKIRGADQAHKQDIPLIECHHCKAGYYRFFFPAQGGHLIACTWCFARIEEVDFENIVMIRKALKK